MLSGKARTILFNIFFRAGYKDALKEIDTLERAEVLRRLEEVCARRKPRCTIEELLLAQAQCGAKTATEVLTWLGLPTQQETPVEEMRQEISDSLVGLSDDQVRRMWRAMRRTA